MKLSIITELVCLACGIYIVWTAPSVGVPLMLSVLLFSSAMSGVRQAMDKEETKLKMELKKLKMELKKHGDHSRGYGNNKH